MIETCSFSDNTLFFEDLAQINESFIRHGGHLLLEELGWEEALLIDADESGLLNVLTDLLQEDRLVVVESVTFLINWVVWMLD